VLFNHRVVLFKDVHSAHTLLEAGLAVCGSVGGRPGSGLDPMLGRGAGRDGLTLAGLVLLPPEGRSGRGLSLGTVRAGLVPVERFLGLCEGRSSGGEVTETRGGLGGGSSGPSGADCCSSWGVNGGAVSG